MTREDWIVCIVSGILIGAAIWVVMFIISIDATMNDQCVNLGGVFIDGHCLRIEEITMP